MKKQVFSLMVSAAIFTTNPLFAMESNLDEASSKITVSQNQKGAGAASHECGSCNPELLFTNIDPIKGKGVFHIDRVDELLEWFTTKDILILSETSKAMYNYFQYYKIWWKIAKEHYIQDTFQVCPKEQAKANHISYLNLFKEWGENIKYAVKNSLFKKFVETPCTTTWYPYFYENNGKSYHFSIGKRQFELYTNDKYGDLEKRIQNPNDFSLYTSYCFNYGSNNLTNGFLTGIDICIIELKPKKEQ